MVTVLCLDPLRFIEKEAIFHIDNIATTIAFKKGFSTDPLATTVLRAARVVAAGIGCQPFANWERRRSSVGSRIADDLTHNIFTELSDSEVERLLDLGHVAFPPPILQWMIKPGVDLDLGYMCLQWIKESNAAVKLIYMSQFGINRDT